ncbi:hypothetical protein JCM8547_005031 [Rhodosporidiobolus lusitaniae]
MQGLTGGCGGQQDTGEDPPALKPTPTLCVRCKQPAVIHLQVAAWCNDCFHRSLLSRFGRGIDPARLVSVEGLDVFEGRKSERRRGDDPVKNPPKEAGKLVLAFSGGANSRALLELVKTTCFTHLYPSSSAPDSPSPSPSPVPSAAAGDEPTPENEGKKKKKPSRKHGLQRPPTFRECEVVFVDESSVPGFGDDRTAEVRSIVESTAPFFRFTALKLEDVFSLPSSSTSSSTSPSTLHTSFSSSSLPSSPSPSTSSPSSKKDQLLSLLSPSLSPSALESLHSSLLSTLLRTYASTTAGAETLLLGTSATRIAIQMLAGMSAGRGYSVGEDVATFYVDRSLLRPLVVVRPLALVTAKEVAYYARTAPPAARREGELGSLVMRRPGTSVGEDGRVKEKVVELKKKGLGALCEDFILSLESDFPQTVSTVVRTAHKLGLRSADAVARAWDDEGKRWKGEEDGEEEAKGCCCVVCGLPAQPDAHAWRTAITISDLEGAKAILAASSSSAASSASSSFPSHTPLPPVASAASATTPAKRLEPYQPSAAHLLPLSTSSPSDTAPSSTSAALSSDTPAPPTISSTRVPATSPSPSLPLAPYLCYACLLVLQEPAVALSSSSSSRPGQLKSVELPGYAAEAVEARRRREEREKDRDVGKREVKGREGMKREVQEWLLVSEGVSEGEEGEDRERGEK